MLYVMSAFPISLLIDGVRYEVSELKKAQLHDHIVGYNGRIRLSLDNKTLNQFEEYFNIKIVSIPNIDISGVGISDDNVYIVLDFDNNYFIRIDVE